MNITEVRSASPLSPSTYDFRVRAVGMDGLLKSPWVEVEQFPVADTPLPGVPAQHSSSRVRSGVLRYAYDNLNVDNGGAGRGRVFHVGKVPCPVPGGGHPGWSVAQVIADSLEVEITGLSNGTLYKARVRGLVRRSDGTGTDIEGPWSGPSNQERPVRDTVPLTCGVADTRTGAVILPRSLELTPVRGKVFEITSAMHPSADGQFFVLDVNRGDKYALAYNIVGLETRPVAPGITAGADFVAEAEPTARPRLCSLSSSIADIAVQCGWVVAN